MSDIREAADGGSLDFHDPRRGRDPWGIPSAATENVVRAGPGCGPRAPRHLGIIPARGRKMKSDQVTRPISTARLNRLPCVDLPPINVLVSDGPEVRTDLEVGFALRCFQRLSIPNIATLRCRWRDNRYTRGSSTPVLSYLMQLLSILKRPRRIGTELSHDVLNPAHVPL